MLLQPQIIEFRLCLVNTVLIKQSRNSDVFEFKTQCRNELRSSNPLVQVIGWRALALMDAFSGGLCNIGCGIFSGDFLVSNGTPYPIIGNMIKTNFFANLKQL